MNYKQLEVSRTRSAFSAKRIFGRVSLFLLLELCLISAPAVNAGGTTYNQAATTFNFQDISGTGTPVLLGDDEMSSAVPIGFDFRFYDTVYTELYICDNGYVTFLDGQACNTTGPAIPTPGNPDGLIAGFWNDLLTQSVLSSADGLFYATTGAPGSRIFTVMYKNVPNCCKSFNPDYTFEIKLFEGSNNIEVHFVNTTNDGSVARVGVENESGTVGTEFFSGVTGVANNSAVRFALAGTTAADVVIAGRVMTSDGRGLKNVMLTLSGGGLTEPRIATTGTFGYYTFPDLELGQAYVVSIASKRYQFEQTSVIVTPGDSVFDLNFVALP